MGKVKEMTGTCTEQDLQSLNHQEAELAEKKERLLQFLADQQLDAIVIARNENIAWASGGLVDMRVGVLRETAAGSLLITKDGKAYYLTTENELDRFAEEEFARLDYEPLIQPWYANNVQASIQKVVGNGRLAADVPLVSAELVSLQPVRLKMTDAELLRYRWLGCHAAEAATSVLLRLQPGTSEREMHAMLAERLIALGILPSVYLCAADDRIRRYRHAVPRCAVLQRFGMIGFCARRWGLTVSLTRFVHFGKIPDELSGRFSAMAQVNARLLNATREGMSAGDLFAVATEAYASVGYAGGEKLHHQGGATGYAEREWVARPEGAEQVLSQQAFAWNPSMFGAKVEDTVVLHHGMLEVLTPTPQLPVVITEIAGESYQSAGVLAG